MSESQSSPAGPSNINYVPINPYQQPRPEDQRLYADGQYQRYSQEPNPIPQSNSSNVYRPQQTDEQNSYVPSQSQRFYPASNPGPQNNPSVPINPNNPIGQPYQSIKLISQNPFGINPPPQSEEEKVYDEINSRQSFCETIRAIHVNDAPYDPVKFLTKSKALC
jgi:hypothetical protein